ncbi:hypothetical protein LINPERHAP2_LOCUS28641 [Linum perenne]
MKKKNQATATATTCGGGEELFGIISRSGEVNGRHEVVVTATTYDKGEEPVGEWETLCSWISGETQSAHLPPPSCQSGPWASSITTGKEGEALGEGENFPMSCTEEVSWATVRRRDREKDEAAGQGQ